MTWSASRWRSSRCVFEHRQSGRTLRVFKGVGGDVQYIGEYAIDDALPFVWDRAPETGGGPMRQVIRFRLLPARVGSQLPTPGKRSYRPANETPQSNPGDPFARDPNEVDRSLAAHAQTQNALHRFLTGHRVRSWSPGTGEPDFDIAWERKGVVWVGEVKSVTPNNSTRQLRLGLGQVLDYQDSMLLRYPTILAALALSAPPEDRRWVDLCLRNGVVLVWPEIFRELLR